jgi:ABC-type multidrug transport system ATPase subunit
MTDAAVMLDHLTVRYGKLTAVADVSLGIPKGCVYALLGRNGSGKSSTVRCLIGQQKPTAGIAELCGLDAWVDRRLAMELVGVVPENPDVPPETNAERVERFLARVTPNWDRDDFFSRLERFGIPRRQRFGRLSKGQQRQLALALALASSPKLLVLDDPTLGLDAVARRGLYEELVGDLADRRTTVFLTTHDLAGVEGIADRVGVLRDGSLLVDEPLVALKARYCRVAWTTGDGVSTDGLKSGLNHLGVLATGAMGQTGEAVVSDFSEMNFDRFRQTTSVEIQRVDPLSLEEIFVALCGGDRGGR